MTDWLPNCNIRTHARPRMDCFALVLSVKYLMLRQRSIKRSTVGYKVSRKRLNGLTPTRHTYIDSIPQRQNKPTRFLMLCLVVIFGRRIGV